MFSRFNNDLSTLHGRQVKRESKKIHLLRFSNYHPDILQWSSARVHDIPRGRRNDLHGYAHSNPCNYNLCSNPCRNPSSTPVQHVETCLSETEFFPRPEELKNYIGWKYNYRKITDSYWGGELITKDERDYGLSVFRLADKSLVSVFEKFLCHDEAGYPAWEILDVLQTRPLKENERADIAYCKMNGEPTRDFPFVFIDQSNNGKVYQAWSINWSLKKIVLTATEGLSCFINGES